MRALLAGALLRLTEARRRLGASCIRRPPRRPLTEAGRKWRIGSWWSLGCGEEGSRSCPREKMGRERGV